MRGVIVEVSSRKFGVPFECPCCGAAPDTDMQVRAPNGQGLDVPYCRACREHVQAWESAGVASSGVAVLGILIAIVLAIAMNILVAIGVFALTASIAWWLRSSRRAAAKAACGASCAAPNVALSYLGWSGTTSSFSFESPTFAARFTEQNMSIVANESAALRKLREGYKKARLAVPTPAVAAGVAPPPLTARDWLERLESTEGKVARRVALGRALEMIDQPQPRRELVQTVARIELAPLLDKLQRLSSPAAKQSLLTGALESLRTDNIPDELEAAMQQALQARLDELR
jgi:hypothetical protein